jgi:hypothetical protein
MCAEANPHLHEVSMNRLYPRSQAILRQHNAQTPERLGPDVWNSYMLARAAEDQKYDALGRASKQRLLDSQVRGRATRTARMAARRLKVAKAMAADPNLKLVTLARTLGVSLRTLWEDRRSLGLLTPGRCVGCGRPL